MSLDYEKGSVLEDTKPTESKFKRNAVSIAVVAVALVTLFLGGYFFLRNENEASGAGVPATSGPNNAKKNTSATSAQNSTSVDEADRIFVKSGNKIVSILSDGTEPLSHGDLGERKLIGQPIWNGQTKQFALCCQKPRGMGYDLFQYDYDAQTLDMTFSQIPHEILFPVFSADGSKIVYKAMGREQVNVINSDGSKVRNVVSKDFPLAPMDPKFAFDGKSVIFATDDYPAKPSLYRVDITVVDSEPQKIEDIPAGTQFIPSPIDDKVFEIINDFSATPATQSFVVVDLKTKAVETILTEEHKHNESFTLLSWSANGKFVYMIESVDQVEELVKLNLETGEFSKICDIPLNSV